MRNSRINVKRLYCIGFSVSPCGPAFSGFVQICPRIFVVCWNYYQIVLDLEVESKCI